MKTPLTFAAFLFSVSVFAQPGPPTVEANVVNDESNPIPVNPVGRQPYQATYAVISEGGGEECFQIPIPEGKMLTLTSVGVTATSDGTVVPETWVRVLRRRLSGFTIFRYLDDLYSIGPNRWSGIYEPNVFGGSVSNDELSELNYELAICVGPPDAPATFNDARGTVSGYLTDGEIVDGNSLDLEIP